MQGKEKEGRKKRGKERGSDDEDRPRGSKRHKDQHRHKDKDKERKKGHKKHKKSKKDKAPSLALINYQDMPQVRSHDRPHTHTHRQGGRTHANGLGGAGVLLCRR